MNPRARLDLYLGEARARLTALAVARAAGALAGVAFVVTLLAALVFGRGGLGPALFIALRVLLALGAVAVVALLLWRPLRALREHDGARELERRLPAQDGRIETYLDGVRQSADGHGSPLLDLLAADALRVADKVPLDEALPRRRVVLPAVAAGAGVVGLAVLLLASLPLATGARYLWLGERAPGVTAAGLAGGSIQVQPGDVSVRRNHDVAVTAVVRGRAASADVRLHVRFGGGGAWEEAPMQADAEGRHGFTLFALREPAEYYVSSGTLRSANHRVRVVDLPQVESLRLTYDYPRWTGLGSRVQESGGDISAVEGTRVRVDVVTDVPMESPQLVVGEAGSPLRQQGTRGEGALTVTKDGHYRISARFGDELVALTEDFRISVVPDEKPVIQIVKPGRDYRASPIEEVPVALHAEDDFRLEALELKYSVNGGEFRTEKLPAGAKDITAAVMLRLEELQQAGPGGEAPALVPGDLVSYYAVARDRRESVQTDLFLVQVQSFDRRYSQGQGGGGGGGGGGGDEEGEISERQREILLATWKLQRDATGAGRDAERLADNARMLSDLQKTLADQARTLVERSRARMLTGSDPQVKRFVESLEAAAGAMQPAVERLAKQDLQKAIPEEQRALQHLLRAEAAFRDIQVAMQNSRGGGGGGSQAGRDVAEMTQLEMDLEKNQYETESRTSAQSQAEADNETLRRLRELARRQEQLAREQQRQALPPETQRWRQEQLRREAEDLRRRLEQLARNPQQGGSQQGQRGRQGRQGQQDGRSASVQGASGGSQASAADALRQVEQAIRDMDRASQPGAPQGGQRQQQVAEAGQRLNSAAERLERGRREAVGEQFANLAQESERLLSEQRQTERELQASLARARQRAGGTPLRENPAPQGIDFETARQLAERKREIQSRLETLQREMQQARRRAGERNGDAAERVAQARAALDEAGTAARLARSALEIERGRAPQASARDGLITESLEQLREQLGEAARLASRDAQGPGRAEPVSSEELLAELAELRRAWDDAQRANQSGGGVQPGARGSQQGGGAQPGGAQQGGGGGGRVAGGNLGGGSLAWDGAAGNDGRPGGLRDVRPVERATAERLQGLRGRLPAGTLSEADVRALDELTRQLRRGGAGGVDPMSVEYRKMTTLVDQLELAALRAAPGSDRQAATRADATSGESARYRENIAEYYRRLGAK